MAAIVGERLADAGVRQEARKETLAVVKARDGRALTPEELERQVDINIVCATFMAHGASDSEAIEKAAGAVLGPILMRGALPGEGMLARGSAYYEIADQHVETSFLIVTELRVLWTMVMTITPVWSIWFADVTAVTRPDDRWVRITARPRDFPAALRGVNPQGETEALFGFRDGSPAESLVRTLLGEAYRHLTG